MDYTELANSEAGKYLLGEKSGYPIIKTTGNSYHMVVDQVKGRPVIQAKFFTYNRLDELFGIPLTKMDITQKWDYKAFLHYASLEQNRRYPTILMATDTFNPHATGRGRIRNSSGVSFADSHNDTEGDVISDAGFIYTQTASWIINRSFFPFDTSSIIDTTTVTSAFIRLISEGIAKADADTTSIEIVSSTQADNTNLVIGDYDQVGTTSFGSKTIADWNDTNLAENDFTLNASGLANISLTGYSPFAGTTELDRSNTAPSAGANTVQFTISTVVLSVTYTLGGAQVVWWN